MEISVPFSNSVVTKNPLKNSVPLSRQRKWNGHTETAMEGWQWQWQNSNRMVETRHVTSGCLFA